MLCVFCNHEFDEETAGVSCKTCSLMGGCKRVKCPRCGYESPKETGVVKWIRNRIGNRQAKRHK